MRIEISVPPETEAQLQEKAAAAGEDIASLITRVLKRYAERPLSLHEISGDLAEEFRQSGMSEDELTEFLESVKHEERRKRQAS